MGGHVQARGEAAASGLLAGGRKLQLWERIMRARYVMLAGLGALYWLLPQMGASHAWAGGAVLVIGIPYNAFFHWLMRRTGVLHPTMAFADNILVAVVVALAPETFAAAALVLLAISANNVVAFGRRVAMQAGAASYLGVMIVVTFQPPPGTIAPLVTLGAVGAMTLYGVGAVSEDERELRARYRELTSNIDAVVWERRRDQPDAVYVNAEIEHLLGYAGAGWRSLERWVNAIHPDDRDVTVAAYTDGLRRGTGFEVEYRMMAADGRTVWVEDRVRVEVDSTGRWARAVGVMVDITAMKEAAHQVDQFVNLVANINLALAVLALDDPDDPEPTLRVVAVNPEGVRLTGLPVEAMVGRKATELAGAAGIPFDVHALLRVVRTGKGFTVDEYRPRGSAYDAPVYSVFVFPLPGHAVGVAAHDITERTMAAAALRRHSLHDGLTGLPNRVLLNERLRNALKRSRRDGNHVALLVMDLDQFKDVNDALGHEQGDRLLIEVSRRLQHILEDDVDTIARLGGDEFAVLLADGADEAAAIALAARVRAGLEEPFSLGGILLQASASVGIALSPAHGDDAETLAQRADIAMYTAKRLGTGAAVYTADADQSSVRRLTLLGELRGAIVEDDLVLHYQPALDLATGTVHSAEALVRWHHSEHGMLPPAEFIELAEVSGLIRPLTRWVIEHALAQLRTWQDRGISLVVGVNLSVKDLYDRELVPWLDDRLDAWGVAASHLKLEITESQLMDDPLLALEVLANLKALGAATSIDDFGTGYSSLAYLKHLPIDELKIDKSFVGQILHDPNDLVIVRSTIDLAHDLGLSVVAEGIEDAATLDRLAELGCDRAQGFYVSRPIPGRDVAAWLRDHDAGVVRSPSSAAEARLASSWPAPRPTGRPGR